VLPTDYLITSPPTSKLEEHPERTGRTSPTCGGTVWTGRFPILPSSLISPEARAAPRSNLSSRALWNTFRVALASSRTGAAPALPGLVIGDATAGIQLDPAAVMEQVLQGLATPLDPGFHA
jgi:hypothetical protein